MPAARNQEVTVRRPLAKRMPTRIRGRRAAERLCSQWARLEKTLVRNGGRCENAMTGSLTGDSLSKGHPVQGAGFRPATCVVHYSYSTCHYCPSCYLFRRILSQCFAESTVEETIGLGMVGVGSLS